MNTRVGESAGQAEVRFPAPGSCDCQVQQNCQRLQTDEESFVQMQQGHLRLTLSVQSSCTTFFKN